MRYMITKQAKRSFKQYDEEKRIERQEKVLKRWKNHQSKKQITENGKAPKGGPGFLPRLYSCYLCIDMSERKCTALKALGQCSDSNVAMNCPQTCSRCDTSYTIIDQMPVIPHSNDGKLLTSLLGLVVHVVGRDKDRIN